MPHMIIFRSHTGGIATLGYGAVCSILSKQKINASSSACAELVSVSDYFPKLSCAKLFLEAQDIMLKRNIMHQDNTPAMLIEQNGKSSCSKRSYYLSTQYFYVTDAIKQEEMEIVYFPIEVMIADFFSQNHYKEIFSINFEALSSDTCPLVAYTTIMVRL